MHSADLLSWNISYGLVEAGDLLEQVTDDVIFFRVQFSSRWSILIMIAPKRFFITAIWLTHCIGSSTWTIITCFSRSTISLDIKELFAQRVS